MRRIFSRFLLSYSLLSGALLGILVVVCLYIYNLSLSMSYSEGYSHLSTQVEIFQNDLNRVRALAASTGNYTTVIKAASCDAPLNPIERYALEQARKDLANGVAALSQDMIVDYGIVFQNGLCITANRIFDSADECFGVFLEFPGNAGDTPRIPTGFSGFGTYYTPEHQYFTGMTFASVMRLRYTAQQRNTVFFVIDASILFGGWITGDIRFVELYDGDQLLGSYGSHDESAAYHRIEYQDIRGWRGVAYIPEGLIWGKIRPAVNFIMASIAFFLLTGIGLSVYFPRRQSKPVQEQDRMLRTGTFERLLNGLVYSASEWEEARRMFADVPPRWRLCLIRNMGVEETGKKDRSGARLTAEFIVKHIPGPALVHYTGNDSVVIVMPVESERPEPEPYAGLLAEAAALTRSRYHLRISIAVSGPFDGIERLAAAFRQTRQLLRLAGAGVEKAVFFMSDVERDANRFPMEFTDSQRFYELLLQGDQEHAAIMIRHAFDQLRDSGALADSVIYHLFWSFGQVFVRFREENRLNDGLAITLPVYNPQDSIEEIREKLVASAGELCGHITRGNRQREMELRAAVLAYIDANISNHMLNISGVSAALGMSDRHIQSLLREAVGMSFYKYVDQKRMRLAHSLLEESAIPVNDIAMKCGFSLPNSFYKAFKRYFGYPPTELKKTEKQRSRT